MTKKKKESEKAIAWMNELPRFEPIGWEPKFVPLRMRLFEDPLTGMILPGNQKRIKYSEVMALGFKEEECGDNVYFNEFGYPYCIITLDLTKKIYLDWAKETQFCEMIRIDNPKFNNIKKRMPIRDLNHLKEVINFYSDK